MGEKSNILRHIAFTMAILMFFTSAGLAVDFHYCQGSLQNISFFKKAKNCHDQVATHHCEKMAKKACHNSPSDDSLAELKKNCCDNEAFFFQLDSDFGIPSFIDYSHQLSWYAVQEVNLTYTFVDHSYYQPKDYKYYKPPTVESDHIVLFQSFLI